VSTGFDTGVEAFKALERDRDMDPGFRSVSAMYSLRKMQMMWIAIVER
jgi:hypothetical protein